MDIRNPSIWRGRASLALVAALAVSACALPGVNTTGQEGVVQRDVHGSVAVRLQGHTLKLSAADGTPVPDIQLLINGKAYGVSNGHLNLPGGALADANAVVLLAAPGFVPQRIPVGQLDAPVVLQPAHQVARLPVPPKGGKIGDLDGTLAVSLPDGFTAKGDVILATYKPNLPAGATAPTQALGVMLTLPAPLDGLPGFRFDLDAMLKGWDGKGALPAEAADWTEDQRRNALAAAAILAAGVGASPANLAKEGLTLTGHVLDVVPLLDPTPDFNGNVRVAVSSAELGVYLEFTLVSPVGGGLPPTLAGPTPFVASPNLIGAAPLLPDQGGVLVANNGASILSTYGGGILSTYGGGLVSNNGGNLGGEVRSPFRPGFEPNQAKYSLLAFLDFLVPNGGMVVLASETGQLLNLSTPIDGASRYQLNGLPQTRPFVFPEAQVVTINMRTLAPAPAGQPVITGDINAASTGSASWAVRQMANGLAKMKRINYNGFLADVTALRGFMSQADANAMVLGSVQTDAALAASLYAANGYAPQTFNPILGNVTTVAGGVRGYADGTGLAAEFTLGSGSMVQDAAGNFYVTDEGVGYIRKMTVPGYVVTTVAGRGPSPTIVDGPVASATLGDVSSLAWDPAGNLLMLDRTTRTIRKLDLAAGVISTVVTVPAYTERMTVAPDGTIYVSQSRWRTPNETEKIYQIAPGSTTAVWVAGAGPTGFADGQGGRAAFARPRGLCCDSQGNLYIADQGNSAIRKMTPAGLVTTVATGVTYPCDVTYDEATDLLYAVCNTPGAVYRINAASGAAALIAGGVLNGRVDGFGTAAGLYAPGSVHFDAETGILWEADGDAVRMIQ
ncbi:MAG: hypothetical protein JWM80_1808 [Cyanobacteria bacterium RYN_339]|nr:hypothetical protein [Cyanobacteria bacterium RYN_339]